METNLLTIKNWADKMGITASYVYKLVKDGRVEVEDIDGVKFIDLGKYSEIPKKGKG